MPTTPPQQLQQLTDTLAALEGGLPRISAEAKAAVGGWANTLAGTPALAPIAEELRRLDDAIAQGHGGTIADCLSTLSQQTGHAATTATPDVQTTLYQLSDVLKMAAGQVSH